MAASMRRAPSRAIARRAAERPASRRPAGRSARACRRGPPPRSTSIASRTSAALPIARPSGWSMSVSSARTGMPSAPPERDQRPRQLARVGPRRHERAAADLDVHHQRVDPLGDLLGQDRRRDRAGSTRRWRWRRAARRARGRRARAARSGRRARSRRAPARAPNSRGGQRGAEPGDRLQLVERAAGVAEPAPRDHRHGQAARGDRAAPAAARSCRRRRPSSACRPRARAAPASAGARPSRSSRRSRSSSSRVVRPRKTIAISSADSW